MLADALMPARELGVARNRKRRGMRPVGVMLHYDGSTGADRWAVEWFLDPRCGVSYDRLYTDDGAPVDILGGALEEWAAYHAGVCLEEPDAGVPSRRLSDFKGFAYGDANAAYLGYSITTGPGHPATLAQVNALLYDVVATFAFFTWPASEVRRRLVGHSEKAILNPRDNPGSRERWGRLGRKEDPEGPRRGGMPPVLALDAFRQSVALLLDRVAGGWSLPARETYDPHDPLALWRP